MKPGALLVFGGIAACASGCLLPLYTREPAQGRLVRAADGRPVAGAEVHVESAKHYFGGPRQVIGTYETRTDGDGHWRVRGHASLEFVVLLPDAAPNFGDAYAFRAPDGAALSAPQGLSAELDGSGPLRVVVDPSTPLSPVVLPALGLVGGGGQTVSVHGGAVFWVANKRFGAGLRAVGEVGETGFGGAAGVVVSPVLGLMPAVVVEANARWLRSWDAEPASRVGPEIAVTLLAFLRTSVSVLPDDSGASRRWKTFVGVGWGYL